LNNLARLQTDEIPYSALEQPEKQKALKFQGFVVHYKSFKMTFGRIRLNYSL